MVLFGGPSRTRKLPMEYLCTYIKVDGGCGLVVKNYSVNKYRTSFGKKDERCVIRVTKESKFINVCLFRIENFFSVKDSEIFHVD